MRLALTLILCLAAAPAMGSEATALAERVIAAYGGAESIERGGSLKQSGSLDSFRHGKTGTVERVFSRPDKLRIEIRIPGAPPESRILNGETGWRDGREVPPMMAKAMLLQAARLDLPYLIMTAGPGITSIGPVDRGDGRSLQGLEIPMAAGLRLIAVIDAETGYIVSSHGLIEVAPGQGMEFATVYSGHMETDGIVIATEEAHFAQGQPTGRTVLELTDVVQDLPEGEFRP
ncbi:MAG: hypothetical protein JSU82_11970 [Rhodospirillales bacterium]|nr:MAG: hypothetical protein JSU82_11970 [Rhodospirillales bacterium]